MINILIISPEITKGMKSIGPKLLLPLRKNLTLIEYQISQLQKIKPSKITLNIGFEAERILKTLYRYKSINYLINTNYIDTNEGNNLIKYIEDHKPNNLLVFGSGILIKNNPIKKEHLNSFCQIFVLNKPKNNFRIGCSDLDNIEYLFYDMPEPWSEIFYLNNDAISLLLSTNKKIFEQMYLFEIINFLLSKNIRFTKTYINKTNIMKIQNFKDLNTAKLFI
jgi:NDP-sugar pyrophosphorylase family protein